MVFVVTDPAPDGLAVTAGTIISGPDVNDITIDLNIVNQNSGTNDLITDIGADNYGIELFLTDVDLSQVDSDTLGLKVDPTTYPATVRQDALASGGTNTWTGVTASFTVPDNKCQQITHLCARLTDESPVNYIDAVSTLVANTNCIPKDGSWLTCRTGESNIIIH